MPWDIDDSGSEVKVWLQYPDEIEQLADEARADDWSRRIAIRLMGRLGLRASEVKTATPSGLSYSDDGGYWQLEIKGKNTKASDGKATRYAYVPDEVKQELDNYAIERDIAPSEPYVDVSTDSIRRWVRESAAALTDADSDWGEVSSHDLRRSWAHHHLVEEEVSARVMMEIGGWSSYNALEPYLTKPSRSTIGEELNVIQ